MTARAVFVVYVTAKMLPTQKQIKDCMVCAKQGGGTIIRTPRCDRGPNFDQNFFIVALCYFTIVGFTAENSFDL